MFKRTSQHASALAFIDEDVETFSTLEQGYHQDMSKAAQIRASFSSDNAAVYQLPNAAWARRVSGVFSNDLANQSADRAHAVLTEKADGDWLVSVRAPLNNKHGADEICRQFDTGGGRAAAAGINALPESDSERFIAVFSNHYGRG